MTKNKHFRSVFAALLCAVLCMTAFATVAYADGGDYYDDELPPETWQEEPQPEDTTIVPGTPFTEDGIAATRDLLYDKHTNKQFITVETRNGHTLYIVIDYDKLLDEEEERYQTYFLNPVDEADLMALMEDGSGKAQAPAVCTCKDRCKAGAVNTACPVCSVNMTECAGKEAVSEPDDAPPEKEKSNAGGLVIFLVVTLLAGGGAFYYFKIMKPKQGIKGDTDLDDFDFDDYDEDEPEAGSEEQEDEE